MWVVLQATIRCWASAMLGTGERRRQPTTVRASAADAAPSGGSQGCASIGLDQAREVVVGSPVGGIVVTTVQGDDLVDLDDTGELDRPHEVTADRRGAVGAVEPDAQVGEERPGDRQRRRSVPSGRTTCSATENGAGPPRWGRTWRGAPGIPPTWTVVTSCSSTMPRMHRPGDSRAFARAVSTQCPSQVTSSERAT